MGGEALPCVVCGKSLANVFDEVENQPWQGLAFTTQGHYGSTIFDPMDGQNLELNICDECLAVAREKQQVLLGRTSRPVVAYVEHLGRVVVGLQRTVDHKPVLWKEGIGGHDDEDVLVVEPDEVDTDLSHRITWFGNASHLKE
jgi:hypothetical protein